MSQKMFQSRTNNHLVWAMVDSTDFATPESALSTAMTIKVYGKLQGATGVNFLTSGAGSLTNDIQHVGASATGVYTIALAKADLSDASAAWYDQYTFICAGTGAAQQVLVCEGVLAKANVSNISGMQSDIYSLLSDTRSTMDSQFLVVSNYLSNISNYLSNISGMDSDILSAVRGNSDYLSKMSDVLSNAYSAAAQGASRVLLVQSRLSDFESDTVSAFVALSDMTSNILSAALQTNSRVLLVQSRLSDLDSRLASEFSDVYSLLSDTRSTMDSQFAATSDAISNAYSAAVVGASRTLLVQSRLSDFDSRMVSDVSDILSAIGAVTVALTASDVSDIASAVAAAVGVDIGNIYSLLSDHDSNMQSRVPKLVATNSQLSDLHSDLKSYLVALSSLDSDTHSAATAAASRVLLVQSRLSDFDSRMVSDVSDIRSAIAAITVALTASDVSDIASAVAAAVGTDIANIYSLLSDHDSNMQSRVPKLVASQSLLSDVFSTMNSQFAASSDAISNAYSAAVVGASRTLLVQSRLSDLDSRLASDVSDIYSLLSDTLSTMNSQFAATSDAVSNAHSAALVGSSRTLLIQSAASDIYSMLSDVHSDLGVASGILSDVYSAIGGPIAELAQAAPAATPTLKEALMLLYMALRNEGTTTATNLTISNDTGTVIAKATLSDDTTTFTKTELVAGP
jgi:hypothetical protein